MWLKLYCNRWNDVTSGCSGLIDMASVEVPGLMQSSLYNLPSATPNMAKIAEVEG